MEPEKKTKSDNTKPEKWWYGVKKYDNIKLAKSNNMEPKKSNTKPAKNNNIESRNITIQG